MQEKSRGVLLFAFNTAAVNYVKIAEQSARLIQHMLQLPVSLVTDNETTVSPTFDKVIRVNNTFKNVRRGVGENTQWRNGDRYQAYALTPYNETLLIDSDYLMLDTSLLKLFDIIHDYNIFYNNNFLSTPATPLMGPTSLPYVWATAIVFKKTEKTRLLFDFVGRIQRNYQYYRMLYNIQLTNYRNDYAFAIANHVLNGYAHTPENAIPWPLLTAEHPIISLELRNTQIVLREENKAYLLPMQNLHIMDKDFLLSKQFITFVDSVCQD